MSKKRPRENSGPASVAAKPAKTEVAHWKSRLFKNTYTVRGRRYETNHWSVKIQHAGERKTFSLQAANRMRAAAEACRIYTAIIAEGWRSAAVAGRFGFPPAIAASRMISSEASKAGYWMDRLIQRPYAMMSSAAITPELSVRIEHEGISHYFPLGTAEPRLGANRAMQIHRNIIERGWEKARRRFTLELTVGFRWIENPLAWTYTTIHAGSRIRGGESNRGRVSRAGKVGVAIVEPDAGVRTALAWCLDRMEKFYCAAVFESALPAMTALQRDSFQLTLVSNSLADNRALKQFNVSKNRDLETACLRYSIYPDSEGLFAATPGGAVCYLLRRRPPTGFLEPLHGVSHRAAFSNKELTARAWQYFKNIFASRPAPVSGQISTSLTQREHEVLGLLSNGHPDKEIAGRLGISIYTVHEHVRNIFEKLGVHNRTEAVVKYLQK